MSTTTSRPKPHIRYAHGYWWAGYSRNSLYYVYAMSGRSPTDAFDSLRLRTHSDHLRYGIPL